VFASDAEALAAAEKAYAAYESAVDKSLQTSSPDGLDVVATGDALTSAISSAAAFKQDGRKQRGNSTVGKVTPADLGALTMPGAADGVAEIYACLDVSRVEVIDASGKTVSAPDRQVIFPTLVSLVWSASNQALLVSEESVWDGQNFCN
jgi:hypothetical protein